MDAHWYYYQAFEETGLATGVLTLPVHKELCPQCFKLHRPAARQKVDQENHGRYDEQQVNECAANIGNEAEQPQNQQHHKNCPQYVFALPIFFFKL